jgi:membrane protease YdiL (CAAX protease family)
MGQKDSKSQSTHKPLIARPLDTLVFLLPFIAFYELASVNLTPIDWSRDGDRVVAFQLLQIFFELFGATGKLLPGLAVVVILLATQIASRRPWKVRVGSVAGMLVESLVWSAPLLLLNRFTQIAAGGGIVDSWSGELALGVGAGIYEELVFRLILISLIVIVGADILRFSTGSTLVAAVLISAGLFSMHHHPPFGSEPFDAFRFSFRAMAGAYLGAVFVFRGYGPAAGAHIAYNVLIISVAF